MNQTHVSIGQVKRDITELINRVARGGERVILTSRGKPQAALVSLEDVGVLEELGEEERLVRWEHWLRRNESLSQRMQTENPILPNQLDDLWERIRAEKEERLDFLHRN